MEGIISKKNGSINIFNFFYGDIQGGKVAPELPLVLYVQTCPASPKLD